MININFFKNFPRTMSRSITFNGVKATIIFQDATPDKPTINWQLVIKSGDNEAMIDGSININPVQPVDPVQPIDPIQLVDPVQLVQPIDPVQLVQFFQPIDPVQPIDPKENKDMKKCKKYIRNCIKSVLNSNIRTEKILHTINLFDYLTNEAFYFLESQPILKKTSIIKAYELKNEGRDVPELVQSIHAFLTSIGEPLDQPLDQPLDKPLDQPLDQPLDKPLDQPLDKPLDQPLDQPRDYPKQEYIDECGYRWPAFVGKVVDKDDDKRSLLQQIFKKENLIFKIEYMNLYYNWEKTAPKLNRFQKMKAFILANKDTFVEKQPKDERKTLMMSIFKTKNLEFKDEYMNMYYDWEKTAPRLNRYKKMCLFINSTTL